jgi:PD-(D/E)XK endonuclease
MPFVASIPYTKRNTKMLGDRSEAVVLAELIQAGYKVSIPFGEDQRYDLILDDAGVLSRVQVKTGRLRDGAILFNCYSVHAGRNGRLRTYRGAIEFFGVYCPGVEGVYLVPVGEVPSTCHASIRVTASKNGQCSRVKWAHRYRVRRRDVPGGGVGQETGDGVRPRAGEPS